jgi:hypothetical protein
MSNYRINGFRQLERFYSIVYSGKHDIRPQHVSLYLFLLNQNNRNNWIEWFKCPFDLAMAGACIGSKKTYYNSLNDLKEWNLIEYIPGENNWKSPKISLICLSKNEPQVVPQCEQVDEQLPEQVTIQLPEQVSIHIYKLITNKLNNYITLNWSSLVSPKGESVKKDPEESKGLHQKMISIYDDFIIKKTSCPAKIDGIQGKALKSIIGYFKGASKDKTDEGILNSWKHFLASWDKLDSYYQGKLKLSEINSEMVNIINQIKNGAKKTGKHETVSLASVNSFIDSVFEDRESR